MNNEKQTFAEIAASEHAQMMTALRQVELHLNNIKATGEIVAVEDAKLEASKYIAARILN